MAGLLPALHLTRKQKQNLKTLLYRLDWISILDEAIKARPASWKEHPVTEYRNASDEICSALIHALENKGIVTTFKQDALGEE